MAAQIYWPRIFDADFRRNRELPGPNAMLDYGYAVLRSASARAIVAAGLHPSLSLHHVSNSDAYCLADDLMEPLRPAVDLLTLQFNENNADMDNPETRAAIAAVLNADYMTGNGRSPLRTVLVRLAQSLAVIFEGQRTDLLLPKSNIPLDFKSY